MRKMMLMMVAAIMCVAATAQERYEKCELIVGGDTLRYCALAPQQIEQGKSYPLVVFLHGAGERGEDNQAQLLHLSLIHI